MSSTLTFNRLWQEAYHREAPIVHEAARLDAAGLALPLVELARMARTLVAGEAAFRAALRAVAPPAPAARRAAVRAMIAHLEEAR